jgi:hypothetical protein
MLIKIQYLFFRVNRLVSRGRELGNLEFDYEVRKV